VQATSRETSWQLVHYLGRHCGDPLPLASGNQAV
jgi:hypothetical protein